MSKIKHYSGEPVLLILDDLDLVYGALYDLFNQRFAENTENRYCNVVYEDFKETLFVDPNFKCIVFKSQQDLEDEKRHKEDILPSPLMNRFEKHLFNLNDIPGFGKVKYLSINF